MASRRIAPRFTPSAPLLSAAALVVPVSVAVTAIVSSLKTLRHLRGLTAMGPNLPGERRTVSVDGDVIAFRYHPGIDVRKVPLVLIHGWGQCADATWFSVLPHLENPFIAVDLPGHGSSGGETFDFESAARGVLAACDAVGFKAPHLVAHSMGGPVALTVVRLAPGRFSGWTAIATAIAWQPPRISLPLRVFPMLAGRVSPFTLRSLRRQLSQAPTYAESLVWSWRNPPSARVLASSARALRGFDARGWQLELPPVRFLVPSEDSLVNPRVQRKHARRLSADIIEIPQAGHSFFVADPQALVKHLPV